jgi:hypothetical protein
MTCDLPVSFKISGQNDSKIVFFFQIPLYFHEVSILYSRVRRMEHGDTKFQLWETDLGLLVKLGWKEKKPIKIFDELFQRLFACDLFNAVQITQYIHKNLLLFQLKVTRRWFVCRGQNGAGVPSSSISHSLHSLNFSSVPFIASTWLKQPTTYDHSWLLFTCDCANDFWWVKEVIRSWETCFWASVSNIEVTRKEAR